MQSVSSRIWTHVAVFISYDDNNNTTGTSIKWNIIVNGNQEPAMKSNNLEPQIRIFKARQY